MNQINSVKAKIGARAIGFFATPLTSAIDSICHATLFVSKTLTGIVITPVNVFLNNPKLCEYELSSALIHLANTVDSLVKSVILPFIALRNPEKAYHYISHEQGLSKQNAKLAEENEAIRLQLEDTKKNFSESEQKLQSLQKKSESHEKKLNELEAITKAKKNLEEDIIKVNEDLKLLMQRQQRPTPPTASPSTVPQPATPATSLAPVSSVALTNVGQVPPPPAPPPSLISTPSSPKIKTSKPAPSTVIEEKKSKDQNTPDSMQIAEAAKNKILKPASVRPASPKIPQAQPASELEQKLQQRQQTASKTPTLPTISESSPTITEQGDIKVSNVVFPEDLTQARIISPGPKNPEPTVQILSGEVKSHTVVPLPKYQPSSASSKDTGSSSSASTSATTTNSTPTSTTTTKSSTAVKSSVDAMDVLQYMKNSMDKTPTIAIEEIAEQEGTDPSEWEVGDNVEDLNDMREVLYIISNNQIKSVRPATVTSTSASHGASSASAPSSSAPSSSAPSAAALTQANVDREENEKKVNDLIDQHIRSKHRASFKQHMLLPAFRSRLKADLNIVINQLETALGIDNENNDLSQSRVLSNPALFASTLGNIGLQSQDVLRDKLNYYKNHVSLVLQTANELLKS